MSLKRKFNPNKVPNKKRKTKHDLSLPMGRLFERNTEPRRKKLELMYRLLNDDELGGYGFTSQEFRTALKEAQPELGSDDVIKQVTARFLRECVKARLIVKEGKPTDIRAYYHEYIAGNPLGKKRSNNMVRVRPFTFSASETDLPI